MEIYASGEKGPRMNTNERESQIEIQTIRVFRVDSRPTDLRPL
jgi:hypothetical protein